MTSTDDRFLQVNLHLLDRQVVDSDGRLVCKIDDLEFDLDSAGRPHVVAILVGPRALGSRLRGRLGRWIISIARRVADTEMPRIDFRHVADIGSAITLGCSRGDLDIASLEDWVDEHVIARIPGSRHESE